MKRVLGIVVIALLIAVVVGYWIQNEPIDTQETPESSGVASSEQGTSEPADASEYSVLQEYEDEKDVEERTNHLKMFQADDAGNLVLNEKTRLNIEHLHALNSPGELKEKLRQIAEVLPVAAHGQLSDYIQKYDKYIVEFKKKIASQKEPKTIEEVMVQLPVMHELRIKHFGADAAEAFFANEEMTNWQLLNIMSAIKDDSLTMVQKADKAYEMLKADPDLLKAENPYRSGN